ncbi:phage protein Gp36 family protein [Paenibacillus elgii]
MYCTPQNVRDLHQLLSEADFADDYIQKYITKAEARINDKLRPQYVVPLVDPIPDVVQSICADMAGAFLCQHHFSGVNYREDTPLADVLWKRANEDLDYVLEHSTLNGLPGVVEQPPNVPESRRRVATTTPNPSPLTGRLQQFDRATRSPLNGGVWP